MNPRELKRAMKRLGIKMEELRVEKAILELSDGKRMIIEAPQALLMKAKGQPTTIYIMGEPEIVEVKEEEAPSALEISEEDVMLVAEQAGVTPEEARKALEEAGGDIAEAILRLKGEV